MASFEKDNNRPLLNAVGIPYGTVRIEGMITVVVFHLAAGRDYLNHVMEKHGELLSADEAMAIEQQMVGAGLLADMAAVSLAINDFKVPTDHSPTFTFRMCAGCDLEMNHGYIVNSLGRPAHTTIMSTKDGLMACEHLTRKGTMPILDAIAIFQAMKAGDVPENRPEFTREGLARMFQNSTTGIRFMVVIFDFEDEPAPE